MGLLQIVLHFTADNKEYDAYREVLSDKIYLNSNWLDGGYNNKDK
jgi:hypothetical protein